METSKVPCKKCLLKDIDPNKFKEEIEGYINALDPLDRADDTLYEKRLGACRECDKLLTGTCLACGCYVEIRAAGKRAACPKKKW